MGLEEVEAPVERLASLFLCIGADDSCFLEPPPPRPESECTDVESARSLYDENCVRARCFHPSLEAHPEFYIRQESPANRSGYVCYMTDTAYQERIAVIKKGQMIALAVVFIWIVATLYLCVQAKNSVMRMELALKCCFGWLYVCFDSGAGKDCCCSLLTGPFCCGCYTVFYWESKAEQEYHQKKVRDKNLARFSHGHGGNWDEKHEEEGGRHKHRSSKHRKMVGNPILARDDADLGKWVGKHRW